jgi:hypothetical protein
VLTPVEFKSAVIGRREDGDLVIALMDGLPAPLEQERACVALLICSQETIDALCRSAGSLLGSSAK